MYAIAGAGSYGAVLSFTRSRKTGALKQLPGSAGCISTDGADRLEAPRQTCGTAPSLAQGIDIAIAPDGRTVYTLSHLDASEGEAVDVWRRDPATGRLRFLECWTGHDENPACGQGAFESPETFALSPDGKRLYVGGSAIGMLPVNPDGTLGAGTCVVRAEDAYKPACSSAPEPREVFLVTRLEMAPDGTKLYAGGGTAADGQLVLFDVDPATGALRFSRCAGDADGDGTCEPGRALDNVNDIAVSPDGKGVYAAAWDLRFDEEDDFSSFTPSSALSAFTGPLEQLAGTAGCLQFYGGRNPGSSVRPRRQGLRLEGASSVAVSPNGKRVLACFGTGTVLLLRRNRTTQRLTPITGRRGCGTDPPTKGYGCAKGRGIGSTDDIAISADGRHAYVASGTGLSVHRVR